MTFYFYDLETTSGSPRSGRIMQFAGQRTDEHLQPIGKPHNILVKLADDVIPEPDAILVHGITPQKTLEEGLTEAEFTKFFYEEVAAPETVFVGYNNIRFDDEFMRRVCYRSFYDPYQWHWQDGKSRWDLLDPIRMMRALRPEGLKWPMKNGKPTVSLESMTTENGFAHENAHDALSDVLALIQLTQVFAEKQPKLFQYLLSMRSKHEVAKLAEAGAPFVYTSGKYSSDYDKTTVVKTLFKHPRRDSAVVYNLRENPVDWAEKSVQELLTHWKARYNDDIIPLPVKTVQYNKAPAVAPMGVLDEPSQERIKVDMKQIQEHDAWLNSHPEFTNKIREALDILENEQQTRLLDVDVDNQIYDGFWSNAEQNDLRRVRSADPSELTELVSTIKNKRMRELLPLYKARNFPKQLTEDEQKQWERFRTDALLGGKGASRYQKAMQRIQELSKSGLDKNQEYLLTELQLYIESIIPAPDAV